MKITIKILIITFSFLFFSCEKDETANVSEITFFAELELLGDSILFVEQGSTYNDPGINASINGAPVPFDTEGAVDVSTAGVYDLTYSVTNDEGFTASESRTVFVYENNGTIAGIWDGIRVGRAGGPVLISSTADPNIFEMTDILGGAYEYGSGFGRAYATPGQIDMSSGTPEVGIGVNAFGRWDIVAETISADQTFITWSTEYLEQEFGFDIELTKR